LKKLFINLFSFSISTNSMPIWMSFYQRMEYLLMDCQVVTWVIRRVWAMEVEAAAEVA
jgi:hypothetical protein